MFIQVFYLYLHWRKHARFWTRNHHQHGVPKSEVEDFLAQLPSSEVCDLVSVRLWNLKDGGSLKVRFLAKNQHAIKEKSLKNSYE